MRISIITSEPTHPTTAGNRARVVSIVDECIALHHDVHIVLISDEEEGITQSSEHYKGLVSIVRQSVLMKSLRREKKRFSLESLSVRIRVIFGKLVPESFKIWKRFKKPPVSKNNIDHSMPEIVAKEAAKMALKNDPDLVIVNYVYNSLVLDFIPDGVFKMIDTHDVFTDRYALFEKIGIKPEFASFTREAEQKGLRRAHKIIAITDEEKAHFDDLDVPSCSVVGYIGPMFTPMPVSADRDVVFGILGSSNKLNIASMEWLMKSVLADSCLSGLPFRIVVGGNLDRIYRKSKLDSRIEFLGRVDYDDFYNGTHVILNPMLVGTGLKYKSCEALARGKPLITTTIGASGLMRGGNRAFLVADSPSDFANAMAKCIKDVSFQSSLGQEAWIFMDDYIKSQRESLMDVLSACRPPTS